MIKFFRNLNISNKLAAVFLFMLSMMCVGGLVGLYNAGQLASVTEHLYLDSFKRVEILSSIENEFLSARQEMFLNAITTDLSSKSYLTISIKEHKAKISRLILEYKALGFTEGREVHYNRFIEEALGLLVYSLQGRPVFKAREARRGPHYHTDGGQPGLYRDGRRSQNVDKGGEGGGLLVVPDERFLRQGDTRRNPRLYHNSHSRRGRPLVRAYPQSIVRPILAIEESARLVGLGDLRQRVPVMTEDEIGRLAIEFNQMAESLENYYATLEKKVDERTDELSLANIELFAKKGELEQANIELRDANNMKSQFLASVSHELRTPLNSIIGFSELLAERAFGELNERQAQYVDYVHSSGEHLLHLINNILDLSKIETGRIVLSLSEFPVTEAISDVLGIIKPAAHERNITIESKTVPASPKLRADKEKFKKIMLNLLSNAIKFNKEGGHISVGWEIVEDSVGMYMDRYIIFTVADTGIGIREKDKLKLFKEFEQIDSSITREYGGTGLGLVLSKRLVELHKGSIWFESTFGEGSTFYVKLPQGTEEIAMPVSVSPAALSSAADKGPLILLASESGDINHLIEIYLAGDPYDVLSVEDGYDLLRKAHERRPSAIIMGVTIPKKDGWEVLKELKAEPDTSVIPVVMVSSTDNRDMAIKLGAVDYLEKPVNKSKLLAALGRLRLLPPE